MKRRIVVTGWASMAAAAAVSLCGCRMLTDSSQRSAPEAARHLLDGFEGGGVWTLDSADNYGTVEPTRQHVTEGESAMKFTFFDSGRGKTMFRREAFYDLSAVTSLWVDVFSHCAGGRAQCALAFRTESGGFFETAPRDVRPGDNPDIEFRLTDEGMRAKTDVAAWQAQRDVVTRIMILVFPAANRQGALTVDNLRADRPGVRLSAEPRLASVSLPPEWLERHAPVELAVAFEAESLAGSFAGAWALMPVDVQLRLRDPRGEERLIGGFLKEWDGSLSGMVTYAVRFCPDLAGLWHLEFGYLADRHWERLWTSRASCRESTARPGMVGIHPRNPRLFGYADGKTFYPIGQNICWAADYEPYLRAMRDFGGNLVRVWTCPWNYPLLKANDVGEIDLASAASLDRVFDQAAANGICIQLVLSYHGGLREDWDRNPFNARNRGPCKMPEQFWVDGSARQAFKRYLEYVARRWGARPNLFAWELMNEADLAPRFEDRDLLRWHAEMGAFLRAADPHRHLITTSLTGEGKLAEVWRQPWIDFTGSHLYGPDAPRELLAHPLAHREYRKPYFVQEIGRGWLAAADQIDPEGIHLHHGLWLSYLTPAAGCALPWWWDTHIEPNRLQRHFAALCSFHADADRGETDWEPWTVALHTGGGGTVRFQGLRDHRVCLGFAYDPDVIRNPGREPRRPMLAAGHTLVIQGLLDGTYAVEYWDTYAGTVSSRQALRCDQGSLALSLPRSDSDFAFRVRPARVPEAFVEVR